LRVWTPGQRVEETIDDGPVTEIGPGQCLELHGRPQVIFKPEKIAWLSNPEAFDVLDLKIGKNSQWAASGAIPASAFAGIGNRLSAETAHVSMDVIVVVQNVSTEAQKVPRVAIFGKYAT
jgi:hypothetical protein